MTEEVKVWKPSDAAEMLKTRIRHEFMAMIPEETFAKMIESEIKEFLQPHDNYYYNNNRRASSSFQDVVNRILTEITTEECKKILSSPEWQANWQDGNKASSAIAKIITEKGPEIINNVVGSMMQAAIDRMRNM